MAESRISYGYAINKDVAFGFLKLIDVEKVRDTVTDDWFNQTLCEVNDCVVRLGVVQGDFTHTVKGPKWHYVLLKAGERRPAVRPFRDWLKEEALPSS